MKNTENIKTTEIAARLKPIPQEDVKIIQQEYCLFDDLYMNSFMKDQKECAKELIAPIIKKDDLVIKEVITQKDLRSMGGKTIVLDILATDKNDSSRPNGAHVLAAKVAKRLKYALTRM